MQERSLVLAGRAEARPLQRPEKQIPRCARNDMSVGAHLDRSIGSASGSTEKCTVEKERSTRTRLEQRRRMERLM